MKNFNSLPLEVRNMIYDYALDPNHDIFTNGVPALLRVCPHLAREIYSYRKIVTTTYINVSDIHAWSEETEQKHYEMVARFERKENTKGMVVVFERYTREPEHGGLGMAVNMHAMSLTNEMGVETVVSR
ncbi:hypothetical protein E4T48_05438 [Aureobasidium sp. EXF-10727]|nr:hypothetical protein E4T48_05438 [Aureobasidium sp. EXF-10727]